MARHENSFPKRDKFQPRPAGEKCMLTCGSDDK